MTLRHRIAAVAGLAVAMTVLIAAAAIYVAVRAQLRQQIDDALRARAHELAGRRPGVRTRRGRRRSSVPGAPPIATTPPSAARRATRRSSAPTGRSCDLPARRRPAGVRTARAIARAGPARPSPARGRRTHTCACSRARCRRGAGALQVARPLDRGRPPASRRPGPARDRCRSRHRARGWAGRARRARRARADRSASRVARRRSPATPTRRADRGRPATTSSPGWPAASTRRSTR